MTVEEMRDLGGRFSDAADLHESSGRMHMSFKERSWTLKVGAEICERLDKLIALGERDDG